MVPQFDDWFSAIVMLEGEHADTGGATVETPPGSGRHSQPAGRNHPDDVAAGERQHIAGGFVQPADEVLGPNRDLLRRLTARTAVAEQFPAGTILQNVPGNF